MVMTAIRACEMANEVRGDAIVVCTMGAMNAFDQLPPNPLNVACVPLMGGPRPSGWALLWPSPRAA